MMFTKVKNPSMTLMLAEGDGTSFNISHTSHLVMAGSGQIISFPHNQQTTTAFMDGHVASIGKNLHATVSFDKITLSLYEK